MKLIDDKSIDMVLTDLPYAMTERNKWDNLIPFEPMWEGLLRIVSDHGALVFTASQPFTSKLVMSKLKLFRHEWIWEKHLPTNFLNSNKAPLKAHESVLVFYKHLPTYNPQKTEGKPHIKKPQKGKESLNYRAGINIKTERYYDGWKFPRSVQKFSHDMKERLHPTQKPLALFEYMIKTYSNPGHLILDICMGSGTTAISALRTGRNYLGFEADPDIYQMCLERIKKYDGQQNETSNLG